MRGKRRERKEMFAEGEKMKNNGGEKEGKRAREKQKDDEMRD